MGDTFFSLPRQPALDPHLLKWVCSAANNLKWVIYSWLCRPGHLMQHPSLSKSSYIRWRCVLGHCTVEKQMMVPLRNGTLLQNVVAMLVKCAWSCEHWVTSKALTTLPPPRLCCKVGTTHVDTNSSPSLGLTNTTNVLFSLCISLGPNKCFLWNKSTKKAWFIQTFSEQLMLRCVGNLKTLTWGGC